MLRQPLQAVLHRLNKSQRGLEFWFQFCTLLQTAHANASLSFSYSLNHGISRKSGVEVILWNCHRAAWDSCSLTLHRRVGDHSS